MHGVGRASRSEEKVRFAGLSQSPLADSNRRPLLTMNVRRGWIHAGFRAAMALCCVGGGRVLSGFSSSCDPGATWARPRRASWSGKRTRAHAARYPQGVIACLAPGNLISIGHVRTSGGLVPWQRRAASLRAGSRRGTLRLWNIHSVGFELMLSRSGPPRKPLSSASMAAISSLASSKSKDVEVLGDASGPGRLRDGGAALLQVPAQHHLSD